MKNFLNKIYTLINQHLGYIKRLDTACKNDQAFSHNTEHECEFGKLLYGDVMPKVDTFPENIRQSIWEIEKLHKDFHTQAKDMVCPYKKSDVDNLHKTTDFLIIRLTQLEKKAKVELSKAVS